MGKFKNVRNTECVNNDTKIEKLNPPKTTYKTLQITSKF